MGYRAPQISQIEYAAVEAALGRGVHLAAEARRLNISPETLRWRLVAMGRRHMRSHDDGLTNREREVVTLMGAGANEVGVSQDLRISVKAVRVHKSRAGTKIRLAARTGGG